MGPKDKKIIEDSEAKNIPIFVLTAKDSCSVEAIENYMAECRLSGCSLDHVRGIKARIDEFKAWRYKNPAEIKLPD